MRPRKRIEAAYHPELVRDTGHLLIDQLADHFRHVQGGQGAVLPWRAPEENVQAAKECLQNFLTSGADPRQIADRFSKLVALMLERGHALHHPHYIGHQVPASIPMAALFDTVGSSTNQPMAIYDMGPWATAAEYAMIDTLGQQLGWESGHFAGLITHGGSLANLTALLAARNVAIPEFWEQGTAAVTEKAPALVVHQDAHYSVSLRSGDPGARYGQCRTCGA